MKNWKFSQVSGTLGSTMERLNTDIILMLCSYLDLVSLSCLSDALPQWSSLIFEKLKKRIWAIKVVSEHFKTQMG